MGEGKEILKMDFRDFIGYTTRTLYLSCSIDSSDILPLFRITEVLFEDMPELLIRNDAVFSEKSADGKIAAQLEVCYSKLTEDISVQEGEITPLYQNGKEKPIVKLLPQRHGAVLLGSKAMTYREKIEETFRAYPELSQMLSEFSMNHLGADIIKIKDAWGKDLLMAANPIYKELDFTEQPQNGGLFCRVCYRKGRREPLFLKVTGKSKEGEVTGEIEWKLDGKGFLYRTDMPGYHSLDILVKNKDGQLIDQYLDMHFIRKISVNVKAM